MSRRAFKNLISSVFPPIYISINHPKHSNQRLYQLNKQPIDHFHPYIFISIITNTIYWPPLIVSFNIKYLWYSLFLPLIKFSNEINFHLMLAVICTVGSLVSFCSLFLSLGPGEFSMGMHLFVVL